MQQTGGTFYVTFPGIFSGCYANIYILSFLKSDAYHQDLAMIKYKPQSQLYSSCQSSQSLAVCIDIEWLCLKSRCQFCIIWGLDTFYFHRKLTFASIIAFWLKKHFRKPAHNKRIHKVVPAGSTRAPVRHYSVSLKERSPVKLCGYRRPYKARMSEEGP